MNLSITKNKYVGISFFIIGLILPGIIVLVFGNDNTLVKIIAISLFAIVSPISILFIVFDKHFSALLPSSRLRNKLKSSTVIKLDYCSKCFFLIMFIFFSWHITIPFSMDAFDYFVNEKIIEGKFTIKGISSHSYRNYLMGKDIMFAEIPDLSYTYYFAPKGLKISEKYLFTILRRTKVIITSKKINMP